MNPTSKYTSTQVPQDEQSSAQIFAYQGMVGGCGTTSIAVQAAYELSNMGNGLKRHSVCLIDLDFERGDCAAYIDKPASLSIKELNGARGRMDDALAATFVKAYSTNLAYVAPMGELGGNDQVDPDTMLALLDSLCGLFDFIVLDVPVFWRPVSEACLGAADYFTLVTELRIPALHRTRQHLEAVTARLKLEKSPSILINKYDRRGPLGGLNIRDAQHVLERTDLDQIAYEDDVLRLAINNGQPVGKISQDAKFVKAVRSHVYGLLGRELPINAQAVSLFGRKSKQNSHNA